MDRDTSLDVAVTGMAARFPGPAGLAAWWSSLLAGAVHLRPLTRAQLTESGTSTRLIDDPDYVAVHGVLADADAFDNAFFGISPREAQRMDPQHRLALEVAWNALEDAGVPARQADRDGHRTAVFASCTGSGYQRWVLARNDADPAMLDDLIHGTETDFMASRIAYKLGLTGPALAVQTACSSSLVAVHLAVQALTNGDCDRALVVATGLQYPQTGYVHLPGGVQSPTGRCRPFDADADGVVGGSGAACVVLELADELTPDGVPAHGTILGTAVNNDGSAKVGYFAPSAEGQERAIRDALAAAAVAGSTIGYLETHGTGTLIGDPVEWHAADASYRAEGAGPGQIAVGALKANVGHLDSCAGLAALVKALLVLRTGTVPPVAGFATPNPLLADDAAALFVPDRVLDWSGPEPRRAGVSAFGIGGTNAHAIVEAPSTVLTVPTGGPARATILAVSASDGGALDRVVHGLADFMARTTTGVALDEVAHTLVRARTPLALRRAVVADSPAEAVELLRRPTPGPAPRVAGPAPLVLVFPGQGTQSPGMAGPYLGVLPGLADALDDALTGVGDPASRDRLRAALTDPGFPADRLNQTELAQPAIVALQIAVAAALTGLGLRPQATLGHSLGELSAAVAAGAVEPSDALAYAVERGRAMQACPPGQMMALGCSEAETIGLIAGTGLDLAAVNGPEACVVAGTADDIAALDRRLDAAMFRRRLRATRAFHSRLLDPALPVLADAVAALTARPLTCLLGTAGDAQVHEVGTTPDLSGWVRAAREPVRFDETAGAVLDRVPDAVALEIGPGRSLVVTLDPVLPTTTLGSRPAAPAQRDVLDGLAALWVAGQRVDLGRLVPAARTVRLPGYPFAGPSHQPEHTDPAPGHPVGAASRPATPDLPTDDVPPGEGAAGGAPEVVARAWRDLLGRDDLGEDSDFFDVGGDSLLITRMVRSLNHDLGVRVPVRELLRARTLAGHVEVVEQALRPPSD